METQKRFKFWHGGIAAVFVAAVTLGVTGFVFARSEPLPTPWPKTLENPQLTTSVGLPSTNGPDTAPPASSPIPKFSGLDVPWLLNSNTTPRSGQPSLPQPLEIADDAILHGLNDVRIGLLNNSTKYVCNPISPDSCGYVSNPVYIYDDLSVNGYLNAGNAFGTNQINGDLILNGNLRVTGNLKAISIGTFSISQNSNTTVVSGHVAAAASCPSGTKLISCTGSISNAFGNTFYGTSIAGQSCTAKGNKATTVGSITAQAVCFNPNLY